MNSEHVQTSMLFIMLFLFCKYSLASSWILVTIRVVVVAVVVPLISE